MPLFDGYVAVDWSSSATPTRKDAANSIWIAVYDANGMQALKNFTTRQAAMDYIETLLNEATARRLLIGFDFSFGYPEGTALALTGAANWEAVWKRIADIITDGPNNANNRFDAAAVLNQAFGAAAGPFWFNGLKRDIKGLPRKRPDGYGGNLPPRHRYTDHQAPTAQEVWKIGGAGSVGGQALTGIAALERLRQCRKKDVKVWPFETLGEDRHHVLAEIYPSLIDPCPGDEVLDARQVKAVAETLRELDRLGTLAGYLQAPTNMPGCVTAEEGLMLGVHAQAGFRAAAQATPCRGAGAVPPRGYDMQYAEEDARSAFQLAVPPYGPRDHQPVFQELQRRLGPDLGAVTVNDIINALDWLEPNDPDDDYRYLVYLRAFLDCLKLWWETNEEWEFGQAFLWAVHMTSAMLPGAYRGGDASSSN